MKTVCVWCKTELEPNFGAQSDGVVSQGMCPKCLLDLELQTGIDLCKYIDRFREPVLVVDKDNNVRGANRAAAEAVSKDLPAIVNRRTGNVFECAYAHLPEGCGETVHCSGCTVRRTIQKTFSTGCSIEGELVEVVQIVGGQRQIVKMRISAERMSNCILMRIEQD